ncbi:5-formyltetrahydrofolate cyclo-ligase [Geomicrobium sp. JCM 19037]|uniref:5-formyltetrahydrofolate cyclo-ligase n=1 Tax=Geomicrobium sp. JCM 19037 TaxID=1460634 RepID=UPI00045F4D1F|nr:5-formyltetrahydrofolate cyclo-ligase [Geomicrobium sp. JCM 19037]GAK03386.1 5-formyltetrahydrofolate cyclo-ligase [Geomicrobium sp. JCM 19037]
MDQQKKDIRKHITAQLSQLSQNDKEKRAEPLIEQLLMDPFIKEASTVGITLSTAQEIPTQPVIEKLWEAGKHVLIPYAHRNRVLTFHQYTKHTKLMRSTYGILEPDPHDSKDESERLDVVIVPGIAFDCDGFRLGYGGGYYDAFLSRTNVKTISMLYHFQYIHKLPRERHDIPVQKLIVEKRL